MRCGEMKGERKILVRKILLIILVAAFVLSGTRVFQEKIEENRLMAGTQTPDDGELSESQGTARGEGQNAADPSVGGENQNAADSSAEGEGQSAADPTTGSGQSGQDQNAQAGSGESPKVPREDYFNDTLFIGDSRTVGLMEYGQIKGADFFASSGMSVYQLQKEKVSVAGRGSVTFTDLINAKQYGKIYVMLGINELGYNMNTTVKKYAALIDTIRQAQPQATIIIEANLHVTRERSDQDAIYNNANIDAFNARIAELADGKTIFYVDVNPLFDDGAGNLAAQYTNDSSHVLGKYYQVWANWLATDAAVK